MTTLPAGVFSSWLDDIDAAIRGDAGSDVACGTCTACCTSSQFVHIAPDEHDALAHIPKALLFPAPRAPSGHVLMGYDERGHCPMLIDGACTIYEHRPRTCRTYDCRVFPATGVRIDEADKAAIAEQARRWRFAFPTDGDRMRHDAVQAAAAFLEANRSAFPDGAVPRSPTALAVLAIEIRDEFLTGDPRSGRRVFEPDVSAVITAIAQHRSV